MAFCLVTGGAGFIGSHLVDALLARGNQVRVLDDFSTGSLENLAQSLGRIELMVGNLMSLDAVRAAVQGVEIVFHLAAATSLSQSIADPLTVHQVCTTGTLQLLIAAREARVRRVIYSGCASAYGNGARLPNREADPTQPLCPYAVAKLAGESYCVSFSQVFGLETVRLRYFHVYGPRQRWGSPASAVIPRFLEAMLSGHSPSIYGDGLQSRDFTYVEDVVQANLLAAGTPRGGGAVYNVGFGRNVTLLDLVVALNALLGTRVKPVLLRARPGDFRHNQADISQAQAELGYCPSIDLTQGLRRSIDYYKARQRKGDLGKEFSPHFFEPTPNYHHAVKS